LSEFLQDLDSMLYAAYADGRQDEREDIRRGLMDAIGRYFALGHAEGKEGRDHDTIDGAAADCLHEIQTLIAALGAPQAPASEAPTVPDGAEAAERDNEQRTEP
jgi:hypothetical protein